MNSRFLQVGKKDERGFTFIALLIFIAIMSVGLMATVEVWNTAMQRDKEQELLFAGNQIRNAITMYYNQAPGPAGRFPTSLEDLLKDPRYPMPKRYLRKLYPDPITNSSNWELVKGPNGEIYGVHSASALEPLKKSNFSAADKEFEGASKYSDWVFMITGKFVTAPAVAAKSGAQIGRSNP